MKDTELSEVLKNEMAEHDKLYKGSLPFNSKDYKINPDEVIEWQDYCF